VLLGVDLVLPHQLEDDGLAGELHGKGG
jgi:hypothetical protein